MIQELLTITPFAMAGVYAAIWYNTRFTLEERIWNLFKASGIEVHKFELNLIQEKEIKKALKEKNPKRVLELTIPNSFRLPSERMHYKLLIDKMPSEL